MAPRHKRALQAIGRRLQHQQWTTPALPRPRAGILTRRIRQGQRSNQVKSSERTTRQFTSPVCTGHRFARRYRVPKPIARRSTDICFKIADIKDQFDAIQDPDVGASKEQDELLIDGPMLLDGGQATYDLQMVLYDMPSRDVVDRLIFRYFNSAENSIGMYRAIHGEYEALTVTQAILHPPTFEKEARLPHLKRGEGRLILTVSPILAGLVIRHSAVDCLALRHHGHGDNAVRQG